MTKYVTISHPFAAFVYVPAYIVCKAVAQVQRQPGPAWSAHLQRSTTMVQLSSRSLASMWHRLRILYIISGPYRLDAACLHQLARVLQCQLVQFELSLLHQFLSVRASGRIAVQKVLL